MLNEIVINALETAINHYLFLDEATPDRLQKLRGKTVKISFKHTNFNLFLQFSPERVYLLTHSEVSPHVTLTGTPLTFASLWQKSRANQTVTNQDLDMMGDVAVAENLNGLFRQLDIDWEGQFAKLFGDVFAHQVGQFARNAGDWVASTKNTLEKNFTEYIQEEKRLLPTSIELNAFLSMVDTTRDDVERAQARLDRLLKVVANTK
jgi:ubiquinone biosynthesis accessory factor UbiJ